MASLTIKNIPDELYSEIKSVAEQNHRSINSEVIVSLKRLLLPARTTRSDLLDEIRKVRSGIPQGLVDSGDIAQVINEGRSCTGTARN